MAGYGDAAASMPPSLDEGRPPMQMDGWMDGWVFVEHGNTKNNRRNNSGDKTRQHDSDKQIEDQQQQQKQKQTEQLNYTLKRNLI